MNLPIKRVAYSIFGELICRFITAWMAPDLPERGSAAMPVTAEVIYHGCTKIWHVSSRGRVVKAMD